MAQMKTIEMMANDGYVIKDFRLGPERVQARAIDWGQSDRGLSICRAVTVVQIRRRIYGRRRNDVGIKPNILAFGNHPHMVRGQWSNATLNPLRSTALQAVSRL